MENVFSLKLSDSSSYLVSSEVAVLDTLQLVYRRKTCFQRILFS